MPKEMRCELITWSQVERLCQQLAIRIRDSGFQPDRVVAIGRGGYVPARLLCDYLDIMALTSIKIEHYLAGIDKQPKAIIRYPLHADIQNQRVLLVDDVNDSGDTLAIAIRHLQTFAPAEIRTAVMHHKISTHFAVDYYAARIIKWRWLIYPWAVVEDVSGFLRRLSPPPDTAQDAQQQLADHFGIRLPIARLQKILDLMEPAS
ncbi:MAG: phosphoribosyltransferase [Proteobacteria bacterium]|jgi:hypothetical protein|nr:phosphoribosyltransferase [Pseudomonadota bacterium]